MKDEQNPISNFEKLVTGGHYEAMKQGAFFLKEAKAHLRSELSPLPGKRHEFPDINMVAKFVAKKIQTTNHEGIIEDLFDYVRPEAALSLLSLNREAMKNDNQLTKVLPFQEKETYFIRPFLNKAGKKYISIRESLFGGQTVEQLLGEIKMATTAQKKLTAVYDEIKEELSKSEELAEKRSLKTAVGSLSYIANNPTWDMAAIHAALGEDFIRTYGKVDLAQAEEWILTGKLPDKILKSHREVVDIQLDFIVMELDVEGRIFDIQRQRRSNLSLRRHG